MPRYSRSPSPRGRGGARSESPVGRGGRGRTPPHVSLLLRNLSRDTTSDDIRRAASRYGHIQDVYLPKDYFSGEPRGIGFIQYEDPRDAYDAVRYLDRMRLHGREISCSFAEQGRKKPQDFRGGGGKGKGGYGKGKGKGKGGGYGKGAGYDDNSRSPPHRRSPYREREDRYNRRSPSRSLSRGRSPPPRDRSRSPRRSPSRSRSLSRSLSPSADRSSSRSLSRSRSPPPTGDDIEDRPSTGNEPDAPALDERE